ncbi:hypothetical protein L211DRAFT_843443 [Terfezia boudieri ATCC MYA-4762]|uniref:Uncharacterized protein n=1 Tax=Terfezia boudieri ATCC MYA-4762 TaxID=1051890 RepID=A0A3N4LAV1_9PEZI|nr:hypothetical protein L211DRAFT_843443 [Terfezia boudieri ATCC MYA-4762]
MYYKLDRNLFDSLVADIEIYDEGSLRDLNRSIDYTVLDKSRTKFRPTYRLPTRLIIAYGVAFSFASSSFCTIDMPGSAGVKHEGNNVPHKLIFVL